MIKADFTAQELFKHLSKCMGSERFLKMQGLNSDIPFFICPFSTKLKIEVESMIPQLVKFFEKQGIRILNVNLYDLCIGVLKDNGLFDQLVEVEPDNDKSYFLESLQSILDVENYIAPAIQGKIAAFGKVDILLLSGIGEVFPYIRAHNLLNNLQSVAKDFPSILFFPGKYEHTLERGATLQLFDRLPSDKYYRAYDITKCEF